MPLASKEMMREVIKDVSFAERLFSTLLFRPLHLSDAKCDVILKVDDVPCFCLDGLLFAQEGTYGILVAEKEEECEKRFLLLLEGLLRHNYESDDEEKEVCLLCFSGKAENDMYLDFLPFGAENILIDLGIRMFSLREAEKYHDSYSETIQDLFQEEAGNIRNEYLREKLLWTRWELKEQYMIC